jgi:hypothetical protein
MAASAGRGQSSYLRQAWKRRAAINPMHGNRPLKIGLLRHLAKLADVAQELK